MRPSIPFDVVCFGEVLWDILPTGETPGGAPVNVAYHLSKQLFCPAVITCIGKDEAGNKLREIFSGKGLDTTFFQQDPRHETGKVFGIADANKDMSYDIVKPVAWDFISWNDAFTGLVSQAPFFVFGSLAARSDTSRATLLRLLDIAPIKVFDINLRAPHFDKELIKTLLSKTDILKMNQEELGLVSQWFSPHHNTEDNIKFLADTFGLKMVLVTKGGDGASLFVDGSFFNHKGYSVEVEDTVGSGDAFLAGLLSSLHKKLPPVEALEQASRLGAFIATQQGACPDYDLQQVAASDWLKSKT